MKIIIKYLLITMINLFLTTSPKLKNQMLPDDFAQMSEKEFKNFKDMMENALNEYQKLGQDEKQALIDQMKTFGAPGTENLTIEELDKSMKETETMLEELEKTILSEKSEKKDNIDFSIEEKNKTIKKNNEPEDKKTKSAIQKIEEAIDSAVKTMGILSFKIQDEAIFKEFKSNWPSIKEDLEKIPYYLKTIKEFLLNNKEKTVFLEELKNILYSIEKITSLQTSIESLISLEEYESKQKKTNLFQKYGIRHSSENLKSFLENEIIKIKKNIELLEKEDKTKETITKIKGFEYQLDIIEKDLIESTMESEQNNTDNIKIYKKTIEEVIKKITNTMLTALEKENLSQKIESIIKKHFPLEYQKGKEKLAIIKSQASAIEKANNSTKRSSNNSDLFLEKNFKTENLNNDITSKRDLNEEGSESFNYEPIEKDYENNNQIPEEKMFELPQQEFPGNQKNNFPNEKNEKNDSKLEKQEEKTESPRKKIKKKKKNKEQTEIKNKKINAEKKIESEKTIKKETETIPFKLSEILNSLTQNIEDFLLNNKKAYNETNNNNLKKILESEIDKIKNLLKELSQENLEETIKKENTIFHKYKNFSTVETPLFIQEELEKINLLSLNDKTEIESVQNIFYLIKNICEILKKEFNENKRVKNYTFLKEVISEYEKLEAELNKKLNDFYPINTTKPYWLKSKEEIKKEIETKKIALKDQNNKEINKK